MRRSNSRSAISNFLIYSTFPSVLTCCFTWNLTSPEPHCIADFFERGFPPTYHLLPAWSWSISTSHSPCHYHTLSKLESFLPLSFPLHLIYHYLRASSHCLTYLLNNHHGVLFIDLFDTLPSFLHVLQLIFFFFFNHLPWASNT